MPSIRQQHLPRCGSTHSCELIPRDPLLLSTPQELDLPSAGDPNPPDRIGDDFLDPHVALAQLGSLETGEDTLAERSPSKAPGDASWLAGEGDTSLWGSTWQPPAPGEGETRDEALPRLMASLRMRVAEEVFRTACCPPGTRLCPLSSDARASFL